MAMENRWVFTMNKTIYRIYGSNYVAAIIQGTFEMGQYLLGVPKELLDTLKVEPLLGQRNYPFYLVEARTQEGHAFFLDTVEPDTAKKMIRQINAKVLATYEIKEDFKGHTTSPGKDYMGILPHEHEDEDEVSN